MSLELAKPTRKDEVESRGSRKPVSRGKEQGKELIRFNLEEDEGKDREVLKLGPDPKSSQNLCKPAIREGIRW